MPTMAKAGARPGGEGAGRRRFDGGVVYVAGFAPLDRRYAVWKELECGHIRASRKSRPGASSTTPSPPRSPTRPRPCSGPIRRSRSSSRPGTSSRAASSSPSTRLGVADKVKIYGIDISTADIQAMIEPSSPWVATAATNSGRRRRSLGARAGATDRRPGSRPLNSAAGGSGDLKEDNDNGIQTLRGYLQVKVPSFKDSDAAKPPGSPSRNKGHCESNT